MLSIAYRLEWLLIKLKQKRWQLSVETMFKMKEELMLVITTRREGDCCTDFRLTICTKKYSPNILQLQLKREFSNRSPLSQNLSMRTVSLSFLQLKRLLRQRIEWLQVGECAGRKSSNHDATWKNWPVYHFGWTISFQKCCLQFISLVIHCLTSNSHSTNTFS